MKTRPLGQSVKPFLKWAGGKRWLVQRHSAMFPRRFRRYIEPFLGGGSVFFHLAPEVAIVSDTNGELIETYAAIRDEWQHVVRRLEEHQRQHCREYYYYVRGLVPNESAELAARFVYLNRTCWNGLYRVNKHGIFNVPVGTKNAVVCPDDDFKLVSMRLQSAELFQGDFSIALEEAFKDDFVFVDPPYTVKHENNGFIKYNSQLFSWEDQERLMRLVMKAKRRGARVLVLNAFHESIWKLYRGVGRRTEIYRKSVVAGDRDARGSVRELAIRTW